MKAIRETYGPPDVLHLEDVAGFGGEGHAGQLAKGHVSDQPRRDLLRPGFWTRRRVSDSRGGVVRVHREHAH